MEDIATSKSDQKTQVVVQGGNSDTFYGLGFIGALVYYISQAKNLQEGIVGFFKAIVWPAILVYHVFKLLKIDQRVDAADTQEPSI